MTYMHHTASTPRQPLMITRTRLYLRTRCLRMHRHLTNTSFPPPPIYSPLPILSVESTSSPEPEPFFFAPYPALFPRAYFTPLIPAITTWFLPPTSSHGARGALISPLLRGYLGGGASGEFLVPVELSTRRTRTGEYTGFRKGMVPLGVFVEYLCTPTTTHPPSAGTGLQEEGEKEEREEEVEIYLAQHALPPTHPLCTFSSASGVRVGIDNPKLLPLPTPPPLQTRNTSDPHLWMGRPAAARTPLHRDPRGGVFVQMCGEKELALFGPEYGEALPLPRESVGVGVPRSVGMGEERMLGRGRWQEERWVWGGNGEEGEKGEEEKEETTGTVRVRGYKVRLGRGDGVFIPKGWWHAVRGVEEKEEGGRSVCASVGFPSTFPTVLGSENPITFYLLGMNAWVALRRGGDTLG
ncbi:hypothetical protein L211DRAFT_845884 [Terfezia boudieri ATCC MYA-4762]|uniref:JmjC domain-containing protein n=1 Tax=Terfezia boudieri ATCC MYA-4762 TaxID=1051890 RepID=A0A3N4M1S6_9PEZI|nr:hypothetical protein L211DRAFT_845884 [Terfezia boudieri ATCC MYA-4762]